MTVKRVRHIGIVVSNLNKSEKAFKDLFGAKTITPIINLVNKYLYKIIIASKVSSYNHLSICKQEIRSQVHVTTIVQGRMV